MQVAPVGHWPGTLPMLISLSSSPVPPAAAHTVEAQMWGVVMLAVPLWASEVPVLMMDCLAGTLLCPTQHTPVL